jgi:hypothetical protein
MANLLSLPPELLEVIASNLSQNNISAFTRARLSIGMGCSTQGDENSTILHTANFNLEVKYRRGHLRGSRPLYLAIHNADYAMVRLLIEIKSKIRGADIDCALRASCRAIIDRNASPFPDTGPDHPLSKAFRAATELGHNELVDLVSRRIGRPILFLNLSGLR